jgi:hypothetical protein
MKAYNLKKTAKKNDAAVVSEKALAEQRSEMGLTVEKQGTTEKNINLSLPVKDKDNTKPFNAQLEAARKKETGQRITEAHMDKKEVSFGEQKDKPTDINAETQKHDNKKTEVFKKAEEASKKDTAFWDKYVGVQMEGPKTKVDRNVPPKGSQLAQKEADQAMSLMKDADALLFHIHATAQSENRELSEVEKQQVVDITSAKLRLIAQMVEPFRRCTDKAPDPVIKTDRDGVVRVYEQDGTAIDEFKDCQEAKANYPEGDIANE